MQILIDADNVHAARLGVLLAALVDVGVSVGSTTRMIVAGRATALAGIDWPDGADVMEQVGWQRADAALAAAYQPDQEPLVVASGDGDFVQLLVRHPGPVLVVAAADSTAGRMRDVATVVDPVHDGAERVVNWLRGATTA